MLDIIILLLNYTSIFTSLWLGLSNNNPMYALLNLINTLIAGTIFLIILKLIFFSIIFLAIYLGAIAVLFLFVIMLIELKQNKKIYQDKNVKFLDFITILIPILYLDIENSYTSSSSLQKSITTTISSKLFSYDVEMFSFFNWVFEYSFLKELGFYMFSTNIFGVLIAGLLLFIAMIGAIVLTLESINNKMLFQQEASVQTSFQNFGLLFQIKNRLTSSIPFNKYK